MDAVMPPSATFSRPAPRSALDAVMPALQNVKRVLFSPFSARKWLILGLVALLGGVLGGGGGGGGGPQAGPQVSSGGGGGGSGAQLGSGLESLVAWCQAHLDQVLLGAAGLALVVIGLWLALLYVSSVFRFIFLEAVITNETRIRESWRRNKREGLAYMRWRIGFGLAALVVLALLVGLPGVLIYLSLTAGGSPGPLTAQAIIAIVAAAVGFLLCCLGIGAVETLTRDFVLPIMYLRRLSALQAWRVFWPVLQQHKLGFLGYFAVKVLCALGAGIVTALGLVLGVLAAAVPLGLLGLGGWAVVAAVGLTTWSWWYLVVLVPLGVGLLVLLWYWLNCVLLPIPVYFQSYALKYLGFVEPAAQTI